MQKNHISQHIWNGDEERILRIRRATPTYNRREAPPVEIILVPDNEIGAVESKWLLSECFY